MFYPPAGAENLKSNRQGLESEIEWFGERKERERKERGERERERREERERESCLSQHDPEEKVLEVSGASSLILLDSANVELFAEFNAQSID